METKEEILDKECNKYGGFVNVINKCGGTLVSQIWLRTMQEYSDQQTKELKEQLSQKEFELKAADHVLAEKEKEIELLSIQLDVSLKNAKHWYNKANLD
jgi:hypothetical protein